MASIKRSIDLRNLVQELANNKVDPLELVREALSNARDHQAKNVWIRTTRGKPPRNAIDIVVINDGEGMTVQQTAAFWGVSSSVKEDPSRSIGYKGHGSKLFFSCRRLTLATRSSASQPWRALSLDQPLLSNDMELEEGDLPAGHPLESEVQATKISKGVAILIEDCSFEDASRFTNRQAVESYCDWFTVVGDIRSGLFKRREDFHQFVDKPSDTTLLRTAERSLEVLNVFLRVNGEPEYRAIGDSRTKPASEHLEPWRQDANRWLRSTTPGMAAFGHRFADHFESDASAGARRVRDDRTALCLATPAEFSGHPQYGLVMRVEGQRRQLDSYPEGSRQPRGGLFEFDQRFGLWICRDFVPIELRNDWLALALERATEKSRKRLRFDLSKTRFWQVFVNSQEFVLTANRNNVANAATHKAGIVELVAAKIAEALKDDAFRDWIENLQRAVTSSRRTREIDSIKERLDDVTAWFKKSAKSDVEPTAARLVSALQAEDSLRLPVPQSEQEFFYLYALLTGRYAMPLRVIEYDTRLGIDAIAQVVDSKLFVPPIPYARVELKFTVSANVSLGHYWVS